MTQIDNAREKIAEAEIALDDLRAQARKLDERIGSQAARDPLQRFADIAAGNRNFATTDLPALRAERAELADLIAAGEGLLVARRDRLHDLQRDVAAAAIAAMDMSDALAFAEAALRRLDPTAIGAELDAIEAQMAALDRPRTVARDRLEEAMLDVEREEGRFRQDVSRSALLPALRETAGALRAEADQLARRGQSLDRQHVRVREGIADDVEAGFAHVKRIAASQADHVRSFAKEIEVFANAFGARLQHLPVPTTPALDLPTDDEVQVLIDLAGPLLALSRRSAPSRPHDSSYLPKARGAGVVGGRQAA